MVHNSIINKWALGRVIINYNILAKLRRHASGVHFAKIHFREIHFGKIHFEEILTLGV